MFFFITQASKHIQAEHFTGTLNQTYHHQIKNHHRRSCWNIKQTYLTICTDKLLYCRNHLHQSCRYHCRHDKLRIIIQNIYCNRSCYCKTYIIHIKCPCHQKTQNNKRNKRHPPDRFTLSRAPVRKFHGNHCSNWDSKCHSCKYCRLISTYKCHKYNTKITQCKHCKNN